MLDIQFIREHADVVKESQRKRGESVELVDEVLRSDEVRRSSLKEFEAARAQQKEIIMKTLRIWTQEMFQIQFKEAVLFLVQQDVLNLKKKNIRKKVLKFVKNMA